MTFRLIATLTHKSFDQPLTKTIYFQGKDIDDILEKMEAPKEHRHNLKHHRRTAFRDSRGVKHSWKIEMVEDIAQTNNNASI